MASVNQVFIIGNLGRDVELNHTGSGTPVCNLNVATTRAWMDKSAGQRQEETTWHRVTVWGKQAEHCSNYLQKGSQVCVQGRLSTSSYEDQSGQTRYVTEIVAENVQFLGGRPSGQASQQENRQSSHRPDNRQSQRGGGGGNQYGGYMPPPSDDDDCIPF